MNVLRGFVIAAVAGIALPMDGQADELRLGFTVDAKAIFLTREAPPSRAMLSSFAGGGPGAGDLLNAKSLSPGWQPGFKIRLHADVTEQFGVEGGGFFTLPFTDKASTATGPIIDVAVPALAPGATSATAAWESSIHGFQANATYKPFDGLQVFAGIRHLSIDESLNFAFAPSVLSLAFNASNTLVGPQVGVRADARSLFAGMLDPFNIGVEIGGGALFNSISTRMGGVGAAPGAAGSDKVTPFVQASLDVTYALGDGIEFGAGYQVLWIGNIAHVTDQMGTSNLFTGAMAIRTDDILYHGGHVTLTIALN